MVFVPATRSVLLTGAAKWHIGSLALPLCIYCCCFCPVSFFCLDMSPFWCHALHSRYCSPYWSLLWQPTGVLRAAQPDAHSNGSNSKACTLPQCLSKFAMDYPPVKRPSPTRAPWAGRYGRRKAERTGSPQSRRLSCLKTPISLWI